LSEFLEHDNEAAPGLPAELPGDERVLWQGGPDWKLLARSKFHLRKLAAYFLLLLILHQVSQLRDGATLLESLSAGSVFFGLAAIALALVLTLARAIARATLFTITNRRVIIRCGVALPLSMNLPFTKIDNAELRDLPDGYGDIALTPSPDSRASYVLLWPFVRPWRFARVQPMLRAIPAAGSVAGLLAKALEVNVVDEADRPAQPAPAEPAESPEPRRPWYAYPTGALAAAVSLVVVSLVATAWISLFGEKPESVASADVVSEIALRFEDGDDGSVRVIDNAGDSLLGTIEPGDGGFLRSTLRLLAQERTAAGGSRDAAFLVQRTAEGRLLLVDPETGREVDLWAFGPTNAGAFLQFLPPPAEDRTADATGAMSGAEAELAASR